VVTVESVPVRQVEQKGLQENKVVIHLCTEKSRTVRRSALAEFQVIT
jgi:hypothetical protein